MSITAMLSRLARAFVCAALIGAPALAFAADFSGSTPQATFDDTNTTPSTDAIIEADCTDTGSGTEDCDVKIKALVDGTETDKLVLNADGSTLVVTEQQLNIRNNVSTRNVEVIFQDWADTVDDDMNHAFISVNCTNTGSGTENCDYRVAVTEDGGSAETPQRPEIRFSIDADGGIKLGSENNTAFTVETEAPHNDGDVILPGRSIGSSESMIMTQWVEFCGDGPLSGTTYISPSLDDGNDNTLGSTHCHSEDDSTESVANEVALYGPVEVVGLACYISGGGGTDTVTFQLRDDGGPASSDVACTVVLDAANPKACEAPISTEPTLAMGSQLAIGITTQTSDLSGEDVICTLFVTR